MGVFDFNNERAKNLANPKFDKDAVNFRSTKKLIRDAITGNTNINLITGTTKSGSSYSTGETTTGGCWIDNKPIYRKVIQLSASTTPTAETWLETSGTNFSWGTLEVDVVTKVDLMMAYDSTADISDVLPWASGTTSSSFQVDYVNNGFKSIVINSPVWDDVDLLTCVFEYTKTGDTAS